MIGFFSPSGRVRTAVEQDGRQKWQRNANVRADIVPRCSIGRRKSHRETWTFPVRLVAGNIVSVARPMILWPWAPRRRRRAAGGEESDVEPRAPGCGVTEARCIGTRQPGRFSLAIVGYP